MSSTIRTMTTAAARPYVALRRGFRQILVFAAALLLTACGASSITVQGSYPRPNVPPLPLTLGVYYDPSLQDHVYIEYTDGGREEYRVASGSSHMQLFNTVLPAMFERVVVLDSPTGTGDPAVDAVFTPLIDEFQLALPRKTRLEVYEVWVKYNMRLTQPNGDYIADWVLTAYGKVPEEALSGADRGINDATVAALRDLGSNFSLSFTSVPDVRDWLVARSR